jgi:hypothetical protein
MGRVALATYLPADSPGLVQGLAEGRAAFDAFQERRARPDPSLMRIVPHPADH